MTLRTKSYCPIAISLLVCASPGAAFAQSATSAKAVNTPIFAVAISKITVNQKQLTMQFTLKNNAKGRAYIMNARGDRKRSGFFGSGDQLNVNPRVAGLDFCDDTLQHCSGPGFSKDLSRFTVVEPGDMTSFSLNWFMPSPISDKDTFSFTVPLVVRFSSEGDPDQAGSPKGMQFNFPAVHLDRDN